VLAVNVGGIRICAALVVVADGIVLRSDYGL
jgi:hypothetical protein